MQLPLYIPVAINLFRKPKTGYGETRASRFPIILIRGMENHEAPVNEQVKGQYSRSLIISAILLIFFRIRESLQYILTFVQQKDDVEEIIFVIRKIISSACLDFEIVFLLNESQYILRGTLWYENKPGPAQVGAISKAQKSKKTSKCQVFFYSSRKSKIFRIFFWKNYIIKKWTER